MNELSRLDKARLIASAAEDQKAERVVALDVREVTSFADTFVLASGTSDRHVRSVADSIVAALKARGEVILSVEGHDEGRWVLIDCGDAVAHVFQEEIREHYDLERLWSDAPVIDVSTASERQSAEGVTR